MYNSIHQSKIIKKVEKTDKYSNILYWDKIVLRVNMLMNQMLLATKKHDMNRVHMLQNYIVNSNELKIFILKHVINKLYNLYYSNKKTFRKFNEHNQAITLKNVIAIINDRNQFSIKLKVMIKQYVVYLCTKPVFDARSTKYLYHLRNFTQINVHCNYIQVKYIKKKLSMPHYIKDTINHCLDYVEYVDVSKFYTSKYNMPLDSLQYLNYSYYLESINFIVDMVHKIISTDYDWYNLIHIKKLYYSKNYLKNVKYEKHSLGSLLNMFKHYFRSRFLLKKFKFSNYLLNQKTKSYSNDKLKYLYIYLYRIIRKITSISITSQCNKFTNKIIHLLKKRYDLQIKYCNNNLYITNLILNKVLYNINLKKYYEYNYFHLLA